VSNNLAEAQKEEEGFEIETDQEEQQVVAEVSGESEAEEQTSEAKEEELEGYSKRVQDRISKITEKYRSEEAQRKAAVEFAEAVKKQNDELKQRLDELDQNYVGEFGTRIESQISAAKQAYKNAHEEGDAEGMFEAQQKLSQLALDQARLDQAKRQHEQRASQAQNEVPVPQQQQQQKAPPPSPKAVAWAERNDWFGSDRVMTGAAWGIHLQLTDEEGVDPESEEYYTELDRRMRVEFPHKFADTKRESGPRVASAESSASKAPSSKGRRTVKLTNAEVAMAKRLNVPLEEYAKYVKR
jgi:hypothetical protein